MGKEINKNLTFEILSLLLLLILECMEIDSECVHDKYYCINGGSTAESHCIIWRQSTQYKYTKIFENTTLCQSSRNRYWCATTQYKRMYNWDYCATSQCQLSYNLCRDGISWQIFDKSIKLIISHELDTLIILDKSGEKCLISAQCQDCQLTEKLIQQRFGGCQLLKIIRNKSESIIFDNLRHSTIHYFYILPIINGQLEGLVFKLTLRTKISKPCFPYSATIINREIDSITIEWKECQENFTFGRTSEYLLTIIGHSNKTINTTHTSIQIGQLKPCKQYCVTIYAYNDDGYSDSPETTCTFTKHNFDKIKEVKDIEISPFSRKIEWEYENSHNCSVRFQIKLFQNNLNNQIKFVISVNKFIILDNLILNKIYFISITPEFNNEINILSKTHQFHTIQKPTYPEQITVIDKGQTNISIQWKKPISNDNFGNPNGYEISITYPINMIFNTTQTNHVIKDLSPCTKYCVNIRSYNVAGKSNDAQIKCIKTKLGKFDPVTLESVTLNLFSSIFVKWIYENSKKCQDILFAVVYYEADHRYLMEFKTSQNNASLDNVRPNKLYKVKVKPEYEDESGDYSNEIEIFNKHATSSKNNFLYSLLNIPILIFVAIVAWYNKDKITLKLRQIKNQSSILIPQIKTMTSNKTGSNDNIDDKKNPVEILLMRNNYSKTDESSKKEQLEKEFKELGEQARKYEKLHNYTTSVGELEKNKTKNRFMNILPYDQTRVILKRKSKKNDYINASYIPFINKPNEYEYIACQGPIQDTISDFWDMIWENKISIIVMLTKTVEENKFKCLQYWPDSEDETLEFGGNGALKVLLVKELNKKSFVERKLKVFNKNLNEERIIIQLHMLEWFDYSAPKFEDFQSILFSFQDIVLRGNYHPYMIHCSAGVGRTGTFIVLDRIIRRFMDGNYSLSIKDEILEIRKYRKMLVQRAVQFIFIHDFIEYFLKKFAYQTEIEKEENMYFNS